jgi:hypothetical protein
MGKDTITVRRILISWPCSHQHVKSAKQFQKTADYMSVMFITDTAVAEVEGTEVVIQIQQLFLMSVQGR